MADPRDIWLFIPDRPVGLDEDLLWGETNVRESIRQIAARVVAPLQPERCASQPSVADSLTFAVHGKWGMGKSTVLRMIAEEAGRHAARLGVADRLKVCSYAAPAFAALGVDVRTSLVLQLLTTLAGSVGKALDSFVGEAIAVEGRVEHLMAPGAGGSAARQASTLERVAGTLSRLVGFPELLGQRLRESGAVMLVLIDDLDRCKTEFVWDVLDAMQQLSNVQCLYFVMAVDEKHLLQTVKERFDIAGGGGATSPEFAIEKYVQHSVWVPELDPVRVRFFVERLLGAGTPAAKALIENVDLLRYGLVELTPRSIKRCLNTIFPDIERDLGPAQPAATPRAVIKERLLRFTWPDFFGRFFGPARAAEAEGVQDVRLRGTMREIERACAAYDATRDEEQLRFSLRRICLRYQLRPEDLELKVGLARFLGLAPLLFEEPQAASPRPGFAPKPEQRKAAAGVIAEFERLYIAGEAAEAAGDREACLGAAAQILDLFATYREAFSAAQAAWIGNAALNAEHFRDVELATQLFEAAMGLDPEHSNNLQNFVDFVLSVPLRDRLDEARRLIDKLKSGRHAHHKPARTAALEIKHRRLSGGEMEGARARDIDELIDGFLHGPVTRETLYALIPLLSNSGRFGDLRAVHRRYCEQVSGVAEQYVALRLLADTLAASDIDDNEREAMEIYRWLLRSEAMRPSVNEHLAAIQSNYATLLFGKGFRAAAIDLWLQAYRQEPSNEYVRRSLVQAMLAIHQPALAKAVAEGAPVNADSVPQDWQETGMALEDRFLGPGADRWWERLA